MVIHDLHVVGVIIFPVETDPPLIVDPDAVLALSASRKRLESISRKKDRVRLSYWYLEGAAWCRRLLACEREM